MKMKTRLASLLVILATTGPLLSATEVERLRALCAEQEMQIKQLELKISRLTDTPPPSRSTASAPSEARDFETVSEESTYTVKPGDSVERIARKLGTSPATLNKLNGLKSTSIIHPGQKLKVPGKTATVESKVAPSREARKHTVASGETFYRISRKYGVSVDELITANPGVDHRALRVGQVINVSAPAKEIVEAPAPKPAPSLASSPSLPISNNPAPVEPPRASDKPVKISKEITYGDFARKHDTTADRLDELNGLELDPTTVLAQGSELYIPAQP